VLSSASLGTFVNLINATLPTTLWTAEEKQALSVIVQARSRLLATNELWEAFQ
jgi:hypothetical protein